MVPLDAAIDSDGRCHDSRRSRLQSAVTNTRIYGMVVRAVYGTGKDDGRDGRKEWH